MTDSLAAALTELNRTVLGKPGVGGTAVGEHGGAPCLVVYVADASVVATIPARVGGVRVRTEVSGAFRRR